LDAKGGGLRIARRALRALPEAARAVVVRSAIDQLLGDTRSITERNVLAIVRVAESTGAQLDLPRGLRVEVEPTNVVLTIGRMKEAVTPRRRQLVVPGTTRFGAWSVRTELLERPPARIRQSNDAATALLDAEALGTDVWIRPRKAGDRYQPLGRKRAKKLQDVLVDRHVPRSERDGLPLICSRRGIAWVAGQPPAEWAKITPETSKTMRIRATRAEA
jgi:tRNA(Ile)-lysidine synthase